MVRRTRWMFLGMSALTGALAVLSSLEGCRADGTSDSSGSNAGGGGGSNTNASSGSGKGSTSTSTSTSTGTSGSTSTSTSSTSSGGTDGGTLYMPVPISDITTGKVGPGVKVKLVGVVAMSQKFLVSQSKTGSCLWGVFVSTPGLAETGPNTGILVVDYGDQATTSDAGKSYCPRLGIDPKVGGYLHDDTKPGDVIDVSGETSKYLAQCATQPNGATVGGFQIQKVKVVDYMPKGAAVPPAHVMTDPEIVKLASPTDQAFHDMWGNVKVSMKNVTSVPQKDSMGMPSITDQYGHIVLMGSNLQVGDKLYYRGYLKTQNFCYSGPVYPPTQVFTDIEGFSYLDFCTWSVEPNNKCADLAPPSADPKDCNNNAMACP